jgi:hypothetical protein
MLAASHPDASQIVGSLPSPPKSNKGLAGPSLFVADRAEFTKYIKTVGYATQQAQGTFQGTFERNAYQAAAHRLKQYWIRHCPLTGAAASS